MNLKTKVLYLVSLAGFLRAFAQVIYVPSLVEMRADLGTTTAMVGLTLSVYGLFLAFSQIAYGPVVDRFDSKRILLAGMSLFTLGSLSAYLAPGIGLLLLGRSLQALGIAAAAAVGIALITDIFPPAERGRAMGIFSMFNSAGAAIGPAAGALLAFWLSWRLDFLVLALVGVAMILFTLRQLPAQPTRGQKVGLRDMIAVVRTPSTFGALALGLVCFYGLYTVHTLTPVLLAERLGEGEATIGAVATLVAVGVVVGAWFGGRAADRRGLRVTLIVSALGAAVAFTALTSLSAIAGAATPVAAVAVTVLAFGLATGFGFPAQLNIMVDYFPAIRGTAGALQFFARFIGTTMAPTLAGLLVDRAGLPYGFGAAALLLALGALVAILTIVDPRSVAAAVDYRAT